MWNAGRFLLFVLVSAGSLQAVRTQAAPLDYAIPPPSLDLARLNLPPVSDDIAVEGLEGPTVRGRRDEAIRSFERGEYASSLALLEELAGLVDLADNLRLLRAWSATYAGSDDRAATLWAEACAASPNEVRWQEMAGWHLARSGQPVPAGEHYQRAARLEPLEPRLHLMQGLCLWQQGRLPAAQRHLVRAMQFRNAPPQSLLAMAALQAEQGSTTEALGWLRRVLPVVPAEDRAGWIGHPDFHPIAVGQPVEWEKLIEEFSPANRAIAYPTLEEKPVQQPAPAARIEPPAAQVSRFRLSPFAENPIVRQEQIRAHQTDFTMRRLRASEQLSEEETVVEQYETVR